MRTEGGSQVRKRLRAVAGEGEDLAQWFSSLLHIGLTWVTSKSTDDWIPPLEILTQLVWEVARESRFIKQPQDILMCNQDENYWLRKRAVGTRRS